MKGKGEGERKSAKKPKSAKEKAGGSFSRRELLLMAAKSAMVLGALSAGVNPARAEGPTTLPKPATLPMSPDMRKRKNRDLVYRALTDTQFRGMLQSDLATALGKQPNQITDKNRVEAQNILQVVKLVEAQLGKLADELLCSNGGPCGIAAPSPLKR